MTKRYNIVSLLLLASILISGSYTKANSQVSLVFVKNIGQVLDQHGHSRNDIDFKMATGNGLNIFIGSNAIHYQWAKAGSKMSPIAVSTDDLLNNDPMEMYRMDVQLVGANPNATYTVELPTNFYERYYTLGLNGAKAFSYRKITYHNVYPNIDWVFYFNTHGNLEHDFIVRPGGRVNDIQLKYSGAISLELNLNGSFNAVTPMGNITEQAPISFQKENKKSIQSKYVLNNNLLSFSTSQYTGTLVIDPTVEWGTYFGGVENDDIKKTITDKANHLYATGATSSLDNIATIGSHQTIFGGGSSSAGADAFLAKFATDSTKLWSTYYGGSDIDAASAITYDTLGYIYIAGKTKSPSGIATIGTHQQTIGGGIQVDDAFIVKFDSLGERQWGTYFGGERQDGHTALDLHCDKFNNLYLTGNTISDTGIASIGASQQIKASNMDGFLAKFNTAGNLVWSTYYGGSSNETPQTISADELGNIYIAGNTLSTSGMATTGAHQEIFGGGTNDGFVAKFDPSGQRLWGTYFGGPSNDIILSIKNDGLGHLYLAGTSNSTSGIATSNAYQTTLGGAQDIFIAKMDVINGQLLWSSYYGGTLSEMAPSLVIGMDSKLYLEGCTNSTNGIATPDGINTALNGTQLDAFLARFDANGTREWATYLGGNNVDQSYNIAADKIGNLFLCGRTNSTLGLATTGQTILGGGYDGFILKINTCELLDAPAAITGSATVCEGDTVTYYATEVNGATAYQWLLPNGWWGMSEVDSIIVVIGSVGDDIKVAAVNHCGPGDTISLNVTVNALPTPQLVRNGNVLNTTQLFSAYQWLLNDSPIQGATAATHLITENGQYSVIVANTNGCMGTSSKLTVDNITSIGNLLADHGVFVFPNPLKEELQVHMPYDATVQLTNSIGQLLVKEKLSKGNHRLNCNDLVSGLYFLQVFDANGNLLGVQKLTKD